MQDRDIREWGNDEGIAHLTFHKGGNGGRGAFT